MSAIGVTAQEKLAATSVLLSGAGGVGNILAMDLVSSGFRRFWLIDGQSIELDNLSRFPCAALEDTGQPKVKILADHLRRRGAEVEAAFTGNEDPSVEPLYQEAGWIVCASNTVASRLLCASKAVQYRKPLLDVAVADGRSAFAGCIKLRLPGCPWSACPGCYFGPDVQYPRTEALIPTVVAVTAAFAAHVLFQLVTGVADRQLWRHNFITINVGTRHEIEMYRVNRRPTCQVCGSAAGDATPPELP